jgi:hypothetical protein
MFLHMAQVRQYEFDPVVDPDGLWQVASHGEDLAGHLYCLHGVLRERSFFGAVSAVCRCPWVATVVAVEGSQLYSLPWERMQVSQGQGEGDGWQQEVGVTPFGCCAMSTMQNARYGCEAGCIWHWQVWASMTLAAMPVQALFADWPEVAQAFYRTTVGPFWVQPSTDDGCQGGPQQPPDNGGGGAGACPTAADEAAVAGVLQAGSTGASNLGAAAAGGSPVSLATRLLMWDFPMMVRVKRSKKVSLVVGGTRIGCFACRVTGLSIDTHALSPGCLTHHGMHGVHLT